MAAAQHPVLPHLQAARMQLATLREGVKAAAAGDGAFEAAAEAVRQASADADLRTADIVERCRCGRCVWCCFCWLASVAGGTSAAAWWGAHQRR